MTTTQTITYPLWIARVATRRLPFDVDVGPDKANQPVLVYSRCRTEPELGRLPITPASSYDPTPYHRATGCDTCQYALSARRERKRSFVSLPSRSEFLLSIWGDRSAFACKRDHSLERPRLYIRARSERSSTRLGGGKAAWARGRVSIPEVLDLRRTKLVCSWIHAPERRRVTTNLLKGITTEIRLVAPGRKPSVVDFGCVFDLDRGLRRAVGPLWISDVELAWVTDNSRSDLSGTDVAVGRRGPQCLRRSAPLMLRDEPSPLVGSATIAGDQLLLVSASFAPKVVRFTLAGG